MFNAPEKLLKMIPLKGVTADHDFKLIGILLGRLLYGIMTLAAGCGVDCTWWEERAVIAVFATAVYKKDNQRGA